MKQLTLRSIIIGIFGSIIITTSSMYVALRMGALPWPTIFVAILSMSILKMLGNTNLNEINITHTAMSAGAMVSGGLAFTIPGIWMVNANANISITSLMILTVSGTILGTIATAIIRYHYIEKMQLPFPMGIAASETLITSDKGGKEGRVLFSAILVSGLFTFIRDYFEGIIPPVVMSKYLSAKNIFFGYWVSPMALAIGYLISPLFTSVWFLGAIISYFLIIPLGIKLSFFADVGAATAFKNSLGIGMMVGTGVAIPIKYIIPKIKEFSKKRMHFDKKYTYVPVVLAIITFLITVFTDMGVISSIIAIIGVFLATAMSAQITGQTGINPMEIFGIIILLITRLFVNVEGTEAFFVVALVAIATGLAGDVLNDFKSGYLLKTDPKKQIVAELIGGIVGALVSVFVLIIMHKAYGSFGPDTQLPAPQAYAVSTMVAGIPNLSAFIAGFSIGLVLFLANIPAMTLGIGLYLPMFISTTAFVGGMIKLLVDKFYNDNKNTGVIIASGFLGGEGIIGVALAILRVIKGV